MQQLSFALDSTLPPEQRQALELLLGRDCIRHLLGRGYVTIVLGEGSPRRLAPIPRIEEMRLLLRGTNKEVLSPVPGKFTEPGELASWVMQHYSAGYDYYLAAVDTLTKDELLTIAAHLGAKRRYASDRQTAIRILAEAIATRGKSDFVT